MENKSGRIWFTSDLHFNHKNILKYESENRPFDTIEEMNEKLIENWNKTIKNEDIVYMLGDIFMGGGKTAVDEIMPRLKGRKILIRGNHDSNSYVKAMMPYLENVHDMYHLNYNKKLFVLCHYPMREWHSKEKGSIHLYGHVHSAEHRNGFLAEPLSYHVGVDTNNLTPVSIDKIMERLVS